jgi:hypothetical protein
MFNKNPSRLTYPMRPVLGLGHHAGCRVQLCENVQAVREIESCAAASAAGDLLLKEVANRLVAFRKNYSMAPISFVTEV